MPYSDHYDQLEYYKLWYMDHKEQQLKKMTQYYYDNRIKILKQRRKKYKQSKNK
jgi:hypothetical protein